MKTAIATDKAPKAIGPYSQAVTSGNLLFVSGQIPVDPATGNVQADISAQTRQSLENLKAILEKAGTSLDAVVKTTVFITDMNDFAAMNAVYAEYFSGTYPARSTVQVTRLPKDVHVEIEAIAIVDRV